MSKNYFLWDIDGVLRDLSSVFKNRPDRWDYKEDGKDIFNIINKNPSILTRIKPLPYLKIALQFPFLTIITIQPENWKNYTSIWLETHLNSISYNVIWLNKHEDKLITLSELEKKHNCRYFLIDDYPLFSNYSKVILIDTDYNKFVKANYRVSNSNQLKTIINTLNKLHQEE